MGPSIGKGCSKSSFSEKVDRLLYIDVSLLCGRVPRANAGAQPNTSAPARKEHPKRNMLSYSCRGGGVASLSSAMAQLTAICLVLSGTIPKEWSTLEPLHLDLGDSFSGK